MNGKKISFILNGEKIHIEVSPNQTILDVLREELGLTGTKKGCDMGDCGACTILLDGKPVNSCLIMAPEVDGHDILTIEGVSQKGSLHPLQEKFLELGAVQCGYCTPGFIMAGVALLQSGEPLDEEKIKKGIEGHLCRCTGYGSIVKAIQEASKG